MKLGIRISYLNSILLYLKVEQRLGSRSSLLNLPLLMRLDIKECLAIRRCMLYNQSTNEEDFLAVRQKLTAVRRAAIAAMQADETVDEPPGECLPSSVTKLG